MHLRALLFSLLLTVVAADAVRADPAVAFAPAPQDYESALSPYGQWVDASEYGRVWQPAVTVGWQPYVEGYWAWTPAGWTWVSAEPWGWTFHYGRWALLPGGGWVWVPGYVYGPAWVDWYWGDGYVGWAPLPPFGTHVAVINHFIFVHERDFCSPRVRRVMVRYDHVPHQIARGWRGRDSRPPEIHRIERVGRFPVVHVSHDPTQRIVPHRDFEPRRDRPFVRPGSDRDRSRHADRTDPRPPVVERPDRRPPVVTTAPIPRGGNHDHLARPPRGDEWRPGAAPSPVFGMRGADRNTPRPGPVDEGRLGVRAPSAPPPVVSDGVRVNPGAGRFVPGHGGGRQGSMPRPDERSERSGRRHVVPDAR